MVMAKMGKPSGTVLLMSIFSNLRYVYSVHIYSCMYVMCFFGKASDFIVIAKS